MKNGILFVPMLAVLLSGCANQYVLKLTNGQELQAPSKPHLKGANYYYKDAQGHEVVIPQSRVETIQPASMAADEKKFQQPKYPEPKHWWQFWK